MNYKVQHIANKNKIIRDMTDPKSITIHSTANLNSNAQNERDNLNRRGNTSSTGFHIVVDDKQAIECIPLNKVAYHAGDGEYGTGNSSSIGIEMCESGDREKTIENTIQLTAKMLKERNWGIDRLKRHYDWSGKNCPRILNYNNWEGWDIFRNKVSAHLRGLKEEGVAKVKYPVTQRDYAIDGRDYKYDSINVDGTVYAAVRTLTGNLGFTISNQGNKAIINPRKTDVIFNDKKVTVNMVKVNKDTNYIKLDDLVRLGIIETDWIDKKVIINTKARD